MNPDIEKLQQEMNVMREAFEDHTHTGLDVNRVFPQNLNPNGYINMRNPNNNPGIQLGANIYVKDDKLIVQYNDNGTVRWKYLTLSGTGTSWTHTTTQP